MSYDPNWYEKNMKRILALDPYYKNLKCVCRHTIVAHTTAVEIKPEMCWKCGCDQWRPKKKRLKRVANDEGLGSAGWNHEIYQCVHDAFN